MDKIYIFSPITTIMVYLTRKKIKGHTYLYLVKDAWINGKSKHIWQKYIGSEEKIEAMALSNILSKEKKNHVEVENITFGISAALWQIAKEIGLTSIIDEVAGKSRRQGLTLGEYLTIAAINRCSAPCSKSKLGRWFAQDWLATQYKVDPNVLNAQTYWNHFQYLFPNSQEINGDNMTPIEQIELKINKVMVDKYNLTLDTLLYDPTNFFTYSKGGRDWQKGNGSQMLQFGHSKENRNRNRLVAFWLACDRETGVPLLHRTYPGNWQDAGVFKGMNKDKSKKEQKDVPSIVARRLQALGHDPQEVTLVFDNGNISKEGIAALDAQDLHFIASRRPSTHKDLLHIPLEKFTETTLPITGKAIAYYRTTKKIYGIKRTVYLTFDSAKQKKHILRFRAKLAQKINEIQTYFNDRLTFVAGERRKGQGDKWRKRSEVVNKVKSMIGRSPFNIIINFTVEGTVEVPVDQGGRLILHVNVDKTEQKHYEEILGRAVLFTNQDDWSPEAVIWGYREQYIVEHAFKKMKCPQVIAVRPMYHHADPCIQSHVFICVLALQLLSLLRLKLARKNIIATYVEILDELATLQLTKIFSTPKTKPIILLNRTKGLAKKLVKTLRLKRLIKN